MQGMAIDATSDMVGGQSQARSDFRATVWRDDRVATPLGEATTAIEMAVYGKSDPVVRLLLERGAKPSMQAACAAAFIGNADMLMRW